MTRDLNDFADSGAIEPAHSNLRLAPWMRLNGRDLGVVSADPWCCLYLREAGSDFAVAQNLAKFKIPFFLPIKYVGSDRRFIPLWGRYIFCRPDLSARLMIHEKIRPERTIDTFLQGKLLDQLRKVPPFVGVGIMRPNIGERVSISGGVLAGQDAIITGTGVVNGRIALSVVLLGKLHPIKMPAHLVRRIEGQVEQYPLQIKLEDPAVHRDIDLQICEINKELISYLNKNPDRIYSLPPRKFELLVADLLKDMGYDVTVTPATRDGGVDIFAAIKSPIGPVLTVVECKRYDKANKVGIEVIERFMFTIREKFKATCGLIATTSFFSSDSVKCGEQYKWQLYLRDFDSIKEWLGNYGKWSEDRDSGLWLPSALTTDS